MVLFYECYYLSKGAVTIHRSAERIPGDRIAYSTLAYAAVRRVFVSVRRTPTVFITCTDRIPSVLVIQR